VDRAGEAAGTIARAAAAQAAVADGAIPAGNSAFHCIAVRIKSDRMNLSRRDLALTLAALTQVSARSEALPKLGSQIHPYDKLPVRHNGENESRAVMHGTLHQGFPIEVHLTNLAPGGMPHPPHRHAHEEIMLLKNGQLDVMINGETTRVGPGSVVLMGSNDLHGLKNPGPERAEYFIVELSPPA
jgi:quercetin dioxygenase-like cupin family protein